MPRPESLFDRPASLLIAANAPDEPPRPGGSAAWFAVQSRLDHDTAHDLNGFDRTPGTPSRTAIAGRAGQTSMRIGVPKLKKMGSRYLFICLYARLEKLSSRGVYKRG